VDQPVPVADPIEDQRAEGFLGNITDESLSDIPAGSLID